MTEENFEDRLNKDTEKEAGKKVLSHWHHHPEDTKKMLSMYLNSNKKEYDLLQISLEFEVPKRSLISKLVGMKVYEPINRPGTKAKSAKVLIHELENMLGCEFGQGDTGGYNLNRRDNAVLLVNAIREKLEIDKERIW